MSSRVFAIGWSLIDPTFVAAERCRKDPSPWKFVRLRETAHRSCRPRTCEQYREGLFFGRPIFLDAPSLFALQGATFQKTPPAKV